MIGNKLNFVVGAAIFASTVYFLWIKFKKNKKIYKKISKDNISTEKNEIHISKVQHIQTLDKGNEIAVQEKHCLEKAINFTVENVHVQLEDSFKTSQNDNLAIENFIDHSTISDVDSSTYPIANDSTNICADNSIDIICNKLKCITINSPSIYLDKTGLNEHNHREILTDLNFEDQHNVIENEFSNIDLQNSALQSDSIENIGPINEIEGKTMINKDSNSCVNDQSISSDVLCLSSFEQEFNLNNDNNCLKTEDTKNEKLENSSYSNSNFSNDIQIESQETDEINLKINDSISDIDFDSSMKLKSATEIIIDREILVNSPINYFEIEITNEKSSRIKEEKLSTITDLNDELEINDLINNPIVNNVNNNIDIDFKYMETENHKVNEIDSIIKHSLPNIDEKGFINNNFDCNMYIENGARINVLSQEINFNKDNKIKDTIEETIKKTENDTPLDTIINEIISQNNDFPIKLLQVDANEISYQIINDILNVEKIASNNLETNSINVKINITEDSQGILQIGNLSTFDNCIINESKKEMKGNEVKDDLLIRSEEVVLDEIEILNNQLITENISEEHVPKSFAHFENVDINLEQVIEENISITSQRKNKQINSLNLNDSIYVNSEINQFGITNKSEVLNDIEEVDLEISVENLSVNIVNTDDFFQQNNKTYIIEESGTNVISGDDTISQETLNHAGSNSNISHVTDYSNDSSSDSLLAAGTLMEYIEDCLNDKEFDSDLTRSDLESTGKHENWPNDENSMNNIKRDFYDQSTTICSPHPSSESDHAHCVNNLTERVATLSAESILDGQYTLNSSDSEITPIVSFLKLDDVSPELYVEKITYCGKELDIVYFEEAVLEAGGVQTDIKIIRTIPVGLGGRIIGKKGKTKNELMKKFGAKLLIYNHPYELGKQVLEITCNPSVKDDMEKWVNKTLEQILRNTIQTTVSNPEWLKPMIPLGRLVAAHIIDMPTIQHIKLRIYDPIIIKEFNKMQNAMNSDYNSNNGNPMLPRPVAVGCVCVAMIRPDFFVRAQIVEIYDDYAWIYLLDIGKICQTFLFYLFKIREKYMRIPFQVIPARLPHALIKNKNFTSEIIHKRFLCDQKTLKPKMVRIFFPRMSTCCEPCANVYIPMSTLSDTNSNDEFVDLLEVLVSMEVCAMVKETINSEVQVKINTNHFIAFLSEQEKKNRAISNIPVYFQPCNSKFYEDYIDIKSDT